MNGTLFFAADDGTNGTELWKSDGTAAGTVLVKDISPGSVSSVSALLTERRTARCSSRPTTARTGASCGRATARPAGTVLVKDINPARRLAIRPGSLTNVNGTLFFAADDGTNGRELWKSDGTAAGTVLVKDINPGDSDPFPPDLLTNVDGTLFFAADRRRRTATSCGRATARRRARCWSRTSARAATSSDPYRL